jgi:hypothetical protein
MVELEGYPREVWSEDNPDHKYGVKSLCRSCQRIDGGNWDRGWIYNIYSGVIHFMGEDEYTLCGRSATEAQWLWQL